MIKYLKNFSNYINQILESPYYGTSGAGILPLCPNTGRMLLAKRSLLVTEPQTWNLWSGKIDQDEIPVNAALRELREETGYTESIKKINSSFVYKDKNFVFYNFLAIVDEEFIPSLNWETSDYKWVGLEDLENLKPKHFGLQRLLKEDYKTIETILTKQVNTILLDIDNTLCYGFRTIKDKNTTGLLAFKSKEFTTVLRPHLKKFLDYLFDNYDTVGIFTARFRYQLEEFLTGLKKLNLINQQMFNMLIDNSFDRTYFVEGDEFDFKDIELVAKILNKPVNSIRLFDDLHDDRDVQKQYKIICKPFEGEPEDRHLLDVIENKIL